MNNYSLKNITGLSLKGLGGFDASWLAWEIPAKYRRAKARLLQLAK
jgi:hypothetical protein